MLLWKPNGSLDVATDPADLPEMSDGNSIKSESVVRFKNLRQDLKGVTVLRDGSSKVNSTAFSGTTELVTNGTFTSDITSWTDRSTGTASISWSAGAMLLASPTGISIADQTITISATTSGHTLTLDVTLPGTAIVTLSVGTSLGYDDLLSKTISTTGSYSYTFTASGATAYLRIQHSTNPDDATVDNVSIKRTVQPVNLIVEQGGSRYEFAGNNIFQNESSIVSGLTEAQWSAIKYNAYNDTTQQIYALNGTDRKRIEGATVYEWGTDAPSAAPTTAIGALTGLTGTYNAKIAYRRKVGSTVVFESDLSSAGTDRSLSNQSLSVSWTAPTDSQITHVAVYRTLANGLIYYHDQDVAVASTSVDTNTADGALGTEGYTNHDRPPLGSMVLGPAYDGMCFILKDNLLYYCLPKQPEYWPTTYFIEVSNPQFPLKTGVFHNGQLHCLSTREIHYIQGTGHGTFLPIRLNALTGAQGPFGAISVRGKGIYHTGPDGIYLFSGQDQKISEASLEPIFRGETIQNIPGVSSMTTAWLHQHGNRIYFGYQSTGYSYPTNVLVFNIDNGRVAYYTYDDSNVVEIRCITTDDTNNRILVGDSTGFIRVIEDKTVTTDSGNDIAWDTQSKEFTLQTRAHFPRWVKYDVDASSSTTCTGRLILDGSVFQNHTITTNRNTKRRLVNTGNGERCALGVSGTGPVKIYALESE